MPPTAHPGSAALTLSLSSLSVLLANADVWPTGSTLFVLSASSASVAAYAPGPGVTADVVLLSMSVRMAVVWNGAGAGLASWCSDRS